MYPIMARPARNLFRSLVPGIDWLEGRRLLSQSSVPTNVFAVAAYTAEVADRDQGTAAPPASTTTAHPVSTVVPPAEKDDETTQTASDPPRSDSNTVGESSLGRSDSEEDTPVNLSAASFSSPAGPPARAVVDPASISINTIEFQQSEIARRWNSSANPSVSGVSPVLLGTV